jgi:hypothetical protein
MAFTELIFKPTPASIGVVTLDASVRESHTATAKATRHPIEAEAGSQSDVSDHVQVDPLMVEIEGVVTNTPVEWLGGASSVGSKDLAQEAHQELLDTLLRGRLVTVTTTLLEYPNMVLEGLKVERDKDKANALHLIATAVMVSLVELEEDAGAGARPVTKSTKRKGTKKKTEATAAVQTKTSGVKKLLKALF